MSEPTPETPRPDGPVRDNAAWRKFFEHEERMARALRPAEPKIELDYKKSPGDTGPRASWHIEIPAGFDDEEANRVYRKACELHEALLQKYAGDALPKIVKQS